MKFYFPLSVLFFLLVSCSTVEKKPGVFHVSQAHNLLLASDQEFNNYWHSGKAEITSYELSQERYGEIHDGSAALIFVTEQFLAKPQVKANKTSENHIPVLKLNSTKNFNTGIYPYSIMNSVFFPIYENTHALKSNYSCQEWCGQSYIQLNNRKKFDIQMHSYFELEADKKLKLEKELLENELWTLIRISPDKLPTGNLDIIPALEFLGLRHIEIKSYKALATLEEIENQMSYRIEYPGLGRTLIIKFEKEFPFTIESWEESIRNGHSAELITKASKITRIRNAYWAKNKVKDLYLRDSLGLQ